jgi:hypothetical protein
LSDKLIQIDSYTIAVLWNYDSLSGFADLNALTAKTYFQIMETNLGYAEKSLF